LSLSGDPEFSQLAAMVNAQRCRLRCLTLTALAAGVGLLTAVVTSMNSFVGQAGPPRLLCRKGHEKQRVEARRVSRIDAPPVGYDTRKKILDIVKYPHPALRRKNADVEVFDEKLHMLAVNLFDTLRQEGEGIGLAAPQVGINLRVMAYLDRRGEKVVGKLLVNPRIVGRSDEFTTSNEECLSFPGVKGPVGRSDWVEVEAQTVDGKERQFRLEGFEARLFQHEYDHLDGVVFIDHLDQSSLSKNQLKLETLKRRYELDGGQEPAP